MKTPNSAWEQSITQVTSQLPNIRGKYQLVCTTKCQSRKTSNKSGEAVCDGKLQELFRQLKEKYFDYNGVMPDCSSTSEQITRRKIFRLLRLQHRRLHCQLRLNTLGGSPSRARANYRQRSGARHQLAPECGKSSQDLRFHRHQQRDDPNSTRGLDNNFASDRDCDSTTITRLRHRRLRPRRPRRTR
jgi:hypothetical protein